MKSRRIHLLLGGALVALLLSLGGCSLFSSWFGGEEEQAAPISDAEPDAKDEAGEPEPFSGGLLNLIARKAEPGSTTAFLARLADQFGWEDQVTQNAPLKKIAGEGGDGEETIEPFLLSLFYKNGFSILPAVGEGHQFNRDTVVRGAVGTTRLLVTNRNPIRIIFLQPVQNVQIVYHQDGAPPQIFSIDDRAVVAVRQSLLKYYLR